LVYDDIVVGSGLAALGTVMGLPTSRKVLVLCGEHDGQTLYYDAAGAVPCARLAVGGLGEYWHGVIPVSCRNLPAGLDATTLARFAESFYPGAGFLGRMGRPWLFVPRKPIRPGHHWRRLLAERYGSVALLREAAQRIELLAGEVRVHGTSGVHEGRRVWLAAGALHTPRLLDALLGPGITRPTVSDHVICYLGLIDRHAHPGVAAAQVERAPHGAWFECRHAADNQSINTLRPARFGFRRLDAGIEARAAFGLPMGSALSKIARRVSPGLVSEALYNKFGWFAGARFYSVYAQINVPDAYARADIMPLLTPRPEVIQSAIARARAAPAWEHIVPSRSPEKYLQGIHLHGSVDRDALRRTLGNLEGSLRVVDASAEGHVGPEHHSFKIMAAAYSRAAAS
jgi:hypothetical protein